MCLAAHALIALAIPTSPATTSTPAAADLAAVGRPLRAVEPVLFMILFGSPPAWATRSGGEEGERLRAEVDLWLVEGVGGLAGAVAPRDQHLLLPDFALPRVAQQRLRNARENELSAPSRL